MSHADVRINNLARLKSALLSSGMQESNINLFHVINELISETQRLYNIVLPHSHEESATIAVPQINQAYLTHHDETETLNDSRALIYGVGLQKNDTGKRLIVSGATPYFPDALGRGILEEFRQLLTNIHPHIAVTQGKNWIPIDHSQLTFTASSGTWTVASGDLTYCKYAIEGNKFHFSGQILNSSVSATPSELRIAIAGITFQGNDHIGFTSYSEDGFTTRDIGFCRQRVATNTVAFLTRPVGNWATTTNLTGMIWNMIGEI